MIFFPKKKEKAKYLSFIKKFLIVGTLYIHVAKDCDVWLEIYLIVFRNTNFHQWKRVLLPLLEPVLHVVWKRLIPIT